MIDENVPLLVATALESLGHDCFVVARVDPRAVDADIMAQARREARILVTFDSDFSRMIFHDLQPPPAGVVYMRSRPQQAATVSQIFLDLLAAGHLDLAGRFLVIEPSGELRSLPLGS